MSDGGHAFPLTPNQQPDRRAIETKVLRELGEDCAEAKKRHEVYPSRLTRSQCAIWASDVVPLLPDDKPIKWAPFIAEETATLQVHCNNRCMTLTFAGAQGLPTILTIDEEMRFHGPVPVTLGELPGLVKWLTEQAPAKD